MNEKIIIGLFLTYILLRLSKIEYFSDTLGAKSGELVFNKFSQTQKCIDDANRFCRKSIMGIKGSWDGDMEIYKEKGPKRKDKKVATENCKALVKECPATLLISAPSGKRY